jgi:hypothetical protein
MSEITDPGEAPMQIADKVRAARIAATDLYRNTREVAHELRTWPVYWGEDEGPTDLDVAVMQRISGAIFKAGHQVGDVIHGAGLHINYASTRTALRIDRVSIALMERRDAERDAMIAEALGHYASREDEQAGLL